VKSAARLLLAVVFCTAVHAQPRDRAYTHGLVGYQTPNIDRITNEGAATK